MNGGLTLNTETRSSQIISPTMYDSLTAKTISRCGENKRWPKLTAEVAGPASIVSNESGEQ